MQSHVDSVVQLDQKRVRGAGAVVGTAVGVGTLARPGQPVWQRSPEASLSGQAIVDMFARPALLVDGRRLIHRVNQAADRVLAESYWLADRQGTLQCVDPASDQRLGTALSRMATRLPMRIGALNGQPWRWLRIENSTRKHSLPAAVSLLTHETHRAGDALLMVTLHDPAYGGHVDPLILEDLFALTPAEARIACALAKGLSPRDVSLACGVALGTVRTQLKAVFAKTRTRRQAELVRLLVGLSPA